MRQKLGALMAAVALFGAGSIQAQEEEGFYVGLFGGVNLLMNSDVTHTGDPGTVYDADFHTGYLVGANAGYLFECSFAAEIEATWRSNDVDAVRTAGSAVSGVAGDMSALGLMANAVYRFDTESGFLDPYAGVGAGAAMTMIDGRVTSQGVTFDDSDWVFAYQAFLGFAYPWDEMFSFFAEYRFFGTTKGSYTTKGGGGGTAKAEYRAHSVDAGVRVAL